MLPVFYVEISIENFAQKMNGFTMKSDGAAAAIGSRSSSVPLTGIGTVEDVDLTAGVKSPTADAVRATAQHLGLTTQSTNYREFGLSLIQDCELKRKLVAFLDEQVPPPDHSLEPITAFLESPERTSWATHCELIKAKWDLFCESIDEAAHGEVATTEMSAPSGPSRARLTMLWHYPTFSSGNSRFSHVMDPGNVSLKVQQEKIGLPTDVRTQNLIPIRYDLDRNQSSDPAWEENYGHWPAIQRECFEFNRDLLSEDRVIAVMGQNTFVDIGNMVQARGLILRELPLDLQRRVCGKTPRIYISMPPGDSSIRQVIIHMYHGEFARHNNDVVLGAVWDLLWNMACDFAGVPIRAEQGRTGSRDLATIADSTDGWRMDINVREAERRNDAYFTADQIISYFPGLIREHPEIEAQIQEAVANGKRASYIPERFYREQAASRRTAKRLAENAGNERPAKVPKVKMSATLRKWIESDAMRELRGRGGVIDRKFEAFLGTYQVRTALANRGSSKYSKSLETIDRISEAYRQMGEDTKKRAAFSSMMSHHIAFYDAKKFPNGLRYRPEHGPDPFQDLEQDHPCVRLMKGFKKSDRDDVAGPK
ncbi:hypothetical protein Neosp_004460 [[Neocosmospora] mangrovei]